MKNQHYYTEKHTIEDDFKKFDFEYMDKKFVFQTNSGMFSRDYIDFGSRVLLDSLIKIGNIGKVLEVGCGYGAISIPLANFNNNSIIDAVDINEEAIRLCKINCQENDIKNMNVFKSDIFESIVDINYDLIFSNPPIRAGKKVTYKIYEDSIIHLNHGGRFMIVIQKKQGAQSSITKLTEIYGNCNIISKNKGYFVLCSKKI